MGKLFSGSLGKILHNLSVFGNHFEVNQVFPEKIILLNERGLFLDFKNHCSCWPVTSLFVQVKNLYLLLL